ncbi:hypothetical protein DSO57_1029458 [Entomophthora muscae]|uniref:Uncharacterized protein n=1 Tax=Entomophthora muscae TaxID=34485 RepID=A0ACC2SDW7_9FUNG|nr:hypothetical protein DSO57_1029458 [Entomophthora muscae]
MPLFSKPLLTCVLESLYFEDQLVVRLVCKEWYAIIEPFLVRMKDDDHRLTLRDKNLIGKYFYHATIEAKHLKRLYEAKIFFPNLKSLSITNPYSKEYEREFFFKLLHYFSDSGVSISLRNVYQRHINIPVGLKINSIYLGYRCDFYACLYDIDSPHLESLKIDYDNASEFDAENLLALASQKFPSLKRLEFKVGCYRKLIFDIVAFFKSLKYLRLAFHKTEYVFPKVQLETCMESLSLGRGTYQILQDNFNGFCWKGIKELSVIVEDRICPLVDQMFPKIDSLILQQLPDDCQKEIPKTFYLVGPISAPKLNMNIESSNLICNYEANWPAVIRVSFTCTAQNVFKTALDWIFTCLPSIETVTLIIPEIYLQDDLPFKFLKRKKCLSLKSIYSNTKISLSLIKLLKISAPNLLLIACPMDEEIKLGLSKLSLVGEDLPENYFSNKI